jgi:exonuclease SbcD
MKILHTADIHLVDQDDPRWAALLQVVRLAKREHVDALAISGDLFDSDADAEALRVSLRLVFDDVDFDTLVIPGNHDAVSYAAGLYFGERVHILADDDWKKNVIDVEEIHIIGIPFEAMDVYKFHQRLRDLKDLVNLDHTNILLYHGELLDASFDRGSFGPEAGRYMPSRLTFFEELGVDYVLAGHFHTTFDVRTIGDHGFFVYPGSPVSITRREVGKRNAALIEIGNAPMPIPLDTHHFERIDITLNAFDEDEPLELVKARLDDLDPMVTALLSVGGTIRGSEEELTEAIKAEITGLNVESQEFTFRDLSRVLGHPIFTAFEERISNLAQDEEKGISELEAEQIRAVVIQAMSEAGL